MGVRIWVLGGIFSALVLESGIAYGQKGSYKNFAVSLPLINMTGDTTGHFEYNLRGHAALAVEINGRKAREEISEDKMEETGESIISKARGVSVLISRYENPNEMGGFYWTLGAGYREMEADWRVRPNPADPNVNLSLVDDSRRLSHQATLKGATGHGRVGYRYVGTSFPFIAGGFLGVRHFQSEVVDRRSDDQSVAAMTKMESDQLQRRYMSGLDCGVEVGFAF